MSVIEGLFTHEFTISRTEYVSNGQGGWSRVPVEVGTIRGRLRPLGGAERIVADQQQRQITHVLYCLATADIARGDQVDGAGLVVEVLGVREPSQAGHHLEVDCREVQKGQGDAEVSS